MNTEELNEYIFADLVYKYSRIAWKIRVEKMEKEGNNNSYEAKLTEEDLHQGIELLDWYRREGLRILAEPRTNPYVLPENKRS